MTPDADLTEAGTAISRARSDAGVGAAPTRDAGPGYVVRPVPRERQPVLDRLAGATRRFPVHALLEVDVTAPAARIVHAEPPVSWTGFVIASVARSVALHPEVNARKAGNQILFFDHVDIGATVERHWNGRSALDIVMIPDADRKPCSEITEILRRAKNGPAQRRPPRGLTAALLGLPGPMRQAAIRVAATRPRIAATFGPAVGVTSLGMFTRGWGWAIPLAPLTLITTVSGIVDRPVVRDGRITARPMLPLTLSFDHAVIDGAPAARFCETVRTIIETAATFPSEQ